MFVVTTNFSNDESACGPTLLKTVPTTEILIDQVHKFQNNCESCYCFTKSILFKGTVIHIKFFKN